MKTRIEEFGTHDRVRLEDSKRWGYIAAGNDGYNYRNVLIIMDDTGEIEDHPVDYVRHQIDVEFQMGLDIIKKMIDPEKPEAPLLHNAVQLLVRAHRGLLERND